jgi:hypothetical protein
MQQPECPRCRKAGLIRTERIFKAGAGTTAFYCGNCGHSWEKSDEPAPAPPDKPRDIRRPRGEREKGGFTLLWP